MREIKFEVWDKRYECFRDSDDFIVDGDGDLFENERGEISRRLNPDDYEIRQYTGLKDRNGKEIFEGDIVVDTDGERRLVSFENGCFIAGDHYLCDLTECRIISNKFENPELLT